MTSHLLSSDEDLPAFATWLDGCGTIGLDTETSGTKMWTEGFVCTHLSIGASDGSSWVADGRNADLVRSVLRLLSGKPVWAHNADFDRQVISRCFGVWLSLRDSIILVKALWPWEENRSLKALRPETSDTLGRLRERWDIETGETHEGKSWLADACVHLPWDDPVLVDYSAGDAVEVALLVDELRREPLPARQVAAALVDADRLWSAASARGYRVDTERLDSEVGLLASAGARSIERFGVDLTRTTDDVRKWVADRGISITDMTGKETLSKDFYEDAVVPEASREDWGAFLEFRAAATTRNTLSSLKKSLEGGVLHPNINVLDARTGRTTCSHPNLQNITPRVRPMFVARPGHVLVGADYSSVEPRLMAAASEDPAALEDIASGDIYESMAVSIWGEDAIGDKTRRSLAKTTFLAVGYGQGAASMASRLHLSEDEAAELLRDFRRHYSVLRKWSQAQIAEAKKGVRAETLFGRPLPLPEESPKADGSPAEYRIVNWIIQGSASDVLYFATVKIANVLGPEALWLPIHDELIVQVPEAEAETALELLTTGMGVEVNGTKLFAEGEILGDRWRKIGSAPKPKIGD